MRKVKYKQCSRDSNYILWLCPVNVSGNLEICNSVLPHFEVVIVGYCGSSAGMNCSEGETDPETTPFYVFFRFHTLKIPCTSTNCSVCYNEEKLIYWYTLHLNQCMLVQRCLAKMLMKGSAGEECEGVMDAWRAIKQIEWKAGTWKCATHHQK